MWECGKWWLSFVHLPWASVESWGVCTGSAGEDCWRAGRCQSPLVSPCSSLWDQCQGPGQNKGNVFRTRRPAYAKFSGRCWSLSIFSRQTLYYAPNVVSVNPKKDKSLSLVLNRAEENHYDISDILILNSFPYPFGVHWSEKLGWISYTCSDLWTQGLGDREQIVRNWWQELLGRNKLA